MTTKENMIRATFERGDGILRLMPCFIPRPWGKAGRRLRLHPDDYYATGTKRGEMKERWFSSVQPAFADPTAPADEGMSYVEVSKDATEKILLKDFIDLLGAEIIGSELMEKYGTWPMYSKFFDFITPLFFHLHLTDDKAANVGRRGKPESYYFPAAYNNYEGDFPHTYFGFDHGVTKEDVKERLRNFSMEDNRITELSRAFRLKRDTGWFVPAGVIHAPGSLCTYEPQWNSDVNAVFDNVTAGEVNSRESLVQQVPEDKKNDLDYIISLLDWDKNVDPNFRSTFFRPPVPYRKNEQFEEKWISYANNYVAAKELTVFPGQTAIVDDPVAYGCIIIQGHGEFGVYGDAEAAAMLRYGQASADEYFVSEQAAKRGVKIVNHSNYEPMIILKHFGPNHPDTPKTVPAHAE